MVVKLFVDNNELLFRAPHFSSTVLLNCHIQINFKMNLIVNNSNFLGNSELLFQTTFVPLLI